MLSLQLVQSQIQELEQTLEQKLVQRQEVLSILDEVDFREPGGPMDDLGGLIDEFKDMVDEGRELSQIPGYFPQKVPYSVIVNNLFYYILINGISMSTQKKRLYLELSHCLDMDNFEKVLDEIPQFQLGELYYKKSKEGRRPQLKVMEDEDNLLMNLFRNRLVIDFNGIKDDEDYIKKRDTIAEIVTVMHEQKLFIPEITLGLNDYLYYLEQDPRSRPYVNPNVDLKELIPVFSEFLSNKNGNKPSIVSTTKTGVYQISQDLLNKLQFKFILESNFDNRQGGITIGTQFPLDIGGVRKSLNPLEKIELFSNKGDLIHSGLGKPPQYYYKMMGLDSNRDHNLKIFNEAKIDKEKLSETELLFGSSYNHINLKLGERRPLTKEVVTKIGLKKNYKFRFTPIIYNNKPLVELGEADILLYPRSYYNDEEFSIATAIAHNIYANTIFEARFSSPKDEFKIPKPIIDSLKFANTVVRAELKRRERQYKGSESIRVDFQEILREQPIIMENLGFSKYCEIGKMLIKNHLPFAYMGISDAL